MFKTSKVASWPSMRSVTPCMVRLRNSKPSWRPPSTRATSSGEGPCVAKRWGSSPGCMTSFLGDICTLSLLTLICSCCQTGSCLEQSWRRHGVHVRLRRLISQAASKSGQSCEQRGHGRQLTRKHEATPGRWAWSCLPYAPQSKNGKHRCSARSLQCGNPGPCHLCLHHTHSLCGKTVSRPASRACCCGCDGYGNTDQDFVTWRHEPMSALELV